MAGITLSDLTNILEKVIRPAVEDQLYYKTILWNMVGGYNPEVGTGERKNMGILKTSMDNQTFYIPVQTGHSSGAVAIADGGTLLAGKPTLAQANIPARYETGTFQITKQTLAVKDAGVAVRQLDFYVRQNVLAMAIDLNRQGYGLGTGQIGTANASTTSTTFVFKASVNGDIDYTRYTPVGTSLIIGSNSAVTVNAITGVNTITLSSSLTWTAGDVVKKAEGAGVAATEIDGLQEAVSTTLTYQGLDVATYPSWVAGYSNTGGGGGVVLSLADMNTAWVQANRTGDVKYILMNATEMAAYGGLLTGNIRYDYHDVLGGGWKGLDYMGGQAQVVLDYDCPDDMIFFISPDSLTLGEMLPFEWEKGTDGVLLRVQGTLNYEAVGVWFGNLGCFKRSANAVLKNRKG